MVNFQDSLKSIEVSEYRKGEYILHFVFETVTISKAFNSDMDNILTVGVDLRDMSDDLKDL